MKKEHKIIMDALAEYLERAPDLRFGQALFNLNINQFADESPEKKDWLLRDIYNDSDEDIVKRIRIWLAEAKG
jgi:hypothetical protein